MNSNKSKILVGSLTLAALGFLGYIVFRKKSYKEESDKVNEETHDFLPDKIEIVNDVTVYEDDKSPEALMSELSLKILNEGEVTSPEGFLETLNIRFIISSNDYELASELPKSINDLEKFLKNHGLYGRYKDLVENKEDRY